MKGILKKRAIANIVGRLIVLPFIFLLIFCGSSFAAHKHLEKWYQNQWCADRGQTEVVLPDKTRCDCLTSTHAVEVEFARKFYEAIGQSLYYSMQTGKRAGVLLILESKKDCKYWLRLNSVIQHFNLPIDTWDIGDRR